MFYDSTAKQMASQMVHLIPTNDQANSQSASLRIRRLGRTQLGRASPAKGLGLHCWIGLPLSGSQISLTTAVSFILLVCLSVCLLCSGVFVPTLRPLPLASCQPTPAYLGRIVPPRHSHDLDLTLQVINSGNQKPRFQPSSLYPIAGGQ